MNRNYFLWLLKRHRVLIGFSLTLYLCLSMLANLGAPGAGRGFYSACLAASVMSMGMTFILPVVLFSFVHRRSSEDLYFALPLSRKRHRSTILLFAFGLSFGFYFLTVLLSFVIYGIDYVSVQKLLLILLCMAAGLMGLLLISSALYLLGNTMLDGIVLLGAYTLFPVAAVIAESSVIMTMVAGAGSSDASYSIYLSPVYLLLRNVQACLSEGMCELFPALLFLLYSAIGLAGLKVLFDERRTEQAEQVSDHPLAYPAVINLYAVLILLVLCADIVKQPSVEDGVLAVILVGCYIAGMMLYRRRLKPDVKSLCVLGAEALVCFGLMEAMWMTEGFGLAKAALPDTDEARDYEYFLLVDKTDPERIVIPALEDDESIAAVSFRLRVPEGKAEQYREALKVLEAYRKRLIDSYYERKTIDSTGRYSVSEVKEETVSGSIVSYQVSTPLSLQELEVIDRVTEVRIANWKWDPEDEEPMRLEEWKKTMR